MFSIIYRNRVVDVRYMNPIVGDTVYINGNPRVIVEVNYYAKAVWVA